MWKAHLVKTLVSVGFEEAVLDDTLFHNQDNSILLHMHVDDGLLVGKLRPAVLKFIEDLKKHYTLKVKKRPAQHLGYTFVWQDNQSLLVHQNFVDKILEKFGMSNVNPMKSSPPLNFHQLVVLDSPAFNFKTIQKAIGMLNYLALHT
jgi:hypothetical protein